MVDAVVRIFESTATSFQTNGIGYLPDILSCTVIEERNGGFELTMTYPISGKRYSELMFRRILVAKSNPFSNPQPFRIYEITRPINGKVTVYAEHISYDMGGIPVRPFVASTIQTAFQGLKNNAMLPCPFSFFTDKTTSATFGFIIPMTLRSTLAGVEGSILDVYRGEFEFDGYDVKLWNARGLDRGVTIRYGKNLMNLDQDENGTNVYTGVLPYWYSDLEENGGLVQGPIVEAPGTHNYKKIKMLDCSYDFQKKPTSDELKNLAIAYIATQEIGSLKVSTEISFVNLSDSEEYEDLQQLTTVHLCDTVTVEYKDLGVKATAKCVKTNYNVLEDRYNSIELGEAKASLADTLASNNDKLAENFQKKLQSVSTSSANDIKKIYEELTGDIEELDDTSKQAIKDLQDLIDRVAKEEATKRQEAIANATKQITGNLGGYVVLHSSTNADYPDEILVMDNMEVGKAKKLWRWNKSGLGYSKNGYNGPYELAMTQDGVFVADFIKAGAINASLITTGHMSASIIQGGTLILGGKDNGNGTFILRDNANNTVGLMSNAGFSMYKGTISGPSIAIGGNNNQNGTLTVLNSSGTVAGMWTNNSLTINQNGNLRITAQAKNYDGETVERVTSFGNGIRMEYGGQTYFWIAPIQYKNPITAPEKLAGHVVLERKGIIGFGYIRDDTGESIISMYVNGGGSYPVYGKYGEEVVINGYCRIAKRLCIGGDDAFGSASAEEYRRYYPHMTGFRVQYPDGGGWLDFYCLEARFIKNGYASGWSTVTAGAYATATTRSVSEMVSALSETEASKILDIEPVDVRTKTRSSISEEAKIYPEDVINIIPSVVTTETNDYGDEVPVGVDYSKFIPYLIKMVQMLKGEIDELKQK